MCTTAKGIPEQRIASWRRGNKGYEVLNYIYTNSSTGFAWDALEGTGAVKVSSGSGDVATPFKAPFPPDGLTITYRWNNVPPTKKVVQSIVGT